MPVHGRVRACSRSMAQQTLRLPSGLSWAARTASTGRLVSTGRDRAASATATIPFLLAPAWSALSQWRHRSRPDRTTRQPSRAIAFPKSDHPACLPGTIASDGQRWRGAARAYDRFARNAITPHRPRRTIALSLPPARVVRSQRRQADRPDAARRGRIASAPWGPGSAPNCEVLDRRRYEVLVLRRSWLGMLLRRSSSSARSAMRSSSVISRHTVERRDPDLRTWPAASSSRSSLRVGL